MERKRTITGCNPSSESEGLEHYFTDGYDRIVIGQVGHCLIAKHRALSRTWLVSRLQSETQNPRGSSVNCNGFGWDARRVTRSGLPHSSVRETSIKSRMIEALLCDIDGTLVESNWLHAKAWQDAFGVIEIHLDLEGIRKQIGKGGDELIPVFVPWWKRKYVEEPLKAYRAYIFRAEYLPQVKPLPAVRQFLVRLKQANIRVALATSAHEREVEDYKRIAHIEDLIEEQTSADDASRAKPHPDIFTATLHRLRLRPEVCLALGDTPYDAEAAGLAGVSTIGVTTGGWSCEELLDAGCIEAYESVADLLDHFETSRLVKTGWT